MHPSLEILKTHQECQEFARLMQQHDPELAAQARRKAVELRAESHGATTAIEKEVLQAIYAYEEALSAKKGRRTPAARTWQMVRRHGLIAAAERAVNRTAETSGYSILAEVGLQAFAFKAVVMRHPGVFSPDAVVCSKERLARGVVHGGA